MLRRWVIPYLIGLVLIAAGAWTLIDGLTRPGPHTMQMIAGGCLIGAPLGVLIPMTIDGGWR